MEEKKKDNDTLTVLDLFLVFKLNWLIILIITIACTLVGAIYGFALKKDTYSTSASVIVISKDIIDVDSKGVTSLSEDLLTTNTIKAFMINDVVISAVADELLGSKEWSDLNYQDVKNIIKDGIDISNSNQSLIINVNFSTNSTKVQDKEKFAIQVVNSVVKQSISLLNGTIENDSGEVTYKYGNQLANRLQEVSLASTCRITDSSITIVLIAFILGLVIGYLIGLIKYMSKKNKNHVVKENL
jgi:lipoprotein